MSQSVGGKVLLPFITVTLIWGSTWLVIRDQLGVVPPSWSVAYRFALAGLAMLALALWRRDSLRLEPRALVFVAAVGVAQFVLNFNFVYRAEAYIASGLVAVIFALLIVPNALLARLFFGQRVTRRFLAGSAVAIAGVALLFVHELRADAADPHRTLIGIGFTLLGVLSASVSNVMQSSATARAMPMTTMLAWGMLFGAALDAVWAWATAGPPVFDWRASYIAGLLYLALAASALAFTLYFGVIRAVGPAVAAYSGVLVPIIAMLLSTAFEGYRWSLLAGGGGVLALAGLVIALSARSPLRKSG